MIEQMEVTVPELGWEVLIKRTCAHYNLHSSSELLATPESEEGFLHRITVNYLRHELSQYDAAMDQVAGTVGADDHRLSVKEKVLNAIAEMYLELGSECRRQYNEAALHHDYASWSR